ncbi:emerin isoform X2 [Microcaecilia unicolor]|uniref:Emerin isoform X2 n=1 Tax=Microcaecilia unicolor TaxID=1415580 RepID=A0A6P7XI69_9AMPH|nr:emerin isoform X2 [Microcaecilia unicolor]
MEKYKGMTDEELIASLKKYNIPHGPILKTTRKLYEKKIYAFESQRKRMPPMEVTYDDPDSEQMYEESFSTTKTYDAEPPRYRGTQEVFDSGNINRNYFSQNTYQDVSQYRTASSASPSLRVEPRKAIREKEEPQKRHLFPLWLQLFLLLLFIGFLALVYFFTQYKDENPFQILEE